MCYDCESHHYSISCDSLTKLQEIAACYVRQRPPTTLDAPGEVEPPASETGRAVTLVHPDPDARSQRVRRTITYLHQ